MGEMPATQANASDVGHAIPTEPEQQLRADIIDRNGFVLARKRFENDTFKSMVWSKIYDLGIPPEEVIPLAPSDKDWVEDDDPLRSLAVWNPTPDQCGGLEDPLAVPALQFVKWVAPEPGEIDEDTGEIQ